MKLDLYVDGKLDESYKDYASIHDVLFDTLGKELTHDEIDSCIAQLDKDTQLTGITWGWCDTVFKDAVYKHFRTPPPPRYEH